MVITRTPYRISFFGGGTDYAPWYTENGGAVLCTTIDKYCYISCRILPPFFEHKFRIVYSKVELCRAVDEIQHPSVREALRFMNFRRGLEIHHDGDLPARSGIGSSSSFTVGLLHSLYSLEGVMPDKKKLATDSIYVEQNMIKETVGSQDQVSAAFGGFNRIGFSKEGLIDVQPVTLAKTRQSELNDHLMLFYTGIKRTASEVARGYVDSINDKYAVLRKMHNMVDDGLEILCSSKCICKFGELLHQAWMLKKSLCSKISNSVVDDVYDAAMRAGAIGGKLLGAGSGGFLLLFVPPSSQNKVREALSRLIHVPFSFEHGGSQVIFYEPQQDYVELERDLARRDVASFRELETLAEPRIVEVNPVARKTSKDMELTK